MFTQRLRINCICASQSFSKCRGSSIGKTLSFILWSIHIFQLKVPIYTKESSHGVNIICKFPRVCFGYLISAKIPTTHGIACAVYTKTSHLSYTLNSAGFIFLVKSFINFFFVSALLIDFFHKIHLQYSISRTHVTNCVNKMIFNIPQSYKKKNTPLERTPPNNNKFRIALFGWARGTCEFGRPSKSQQFYVF